MTTVDRWSGNDVMMCRAGGGPPDSPGAELGDTREWLPDPGRPLCDSSIGHLDVLGTKNIQTIMMAAKVP
jgi:hypothetical protein